MESNPQNSPEDTRLARKRLEQWIVEQRYSGFEPYDILNSPFLANKYFRGPLSAGLLIQSGRRFGGIRFRKRLRVPTSENPKALGLFLSAYCDLARLGESVEDRAHFLKSELKRLRSPHEEQYCWGYDWDFISLRGAILRKFSPNSIAICFCAEALMDAASLFHDAEALEMARSAGKFLATRLNRSVDTPDQICFSYTPENHTRIFNNSVLIGALLARLAEYDSKTEFLNLARRSMQYLADNQSADGSWAYGMGRWQGWIDGFHTGYNLCALLDYRSRTSDTSFDRTLDRGYEFYKRTFFRSDGAPKYFHNRLYPIDIHSCSQAILTFCAFSDRDPEALSLAQRSAQWTIANMQSADGTFFYQRHRLWTNRTPYMRWGQAWMFRALTRLEYVLSRVSQRPETVRSLAVTSN